MMKILFLMISLYAMAFGSIVSQSYDDTDVQVLKSFNVDESFLHDENFIAAKSSVLNLRMEKLLQKYDEGFVFVTALKQMINEAGIPQEFLYLAMTESAFNTRAYSPKKAAGLWQFIPSTAKLYGLKIDSYVDERRDPIKSTEVAIKYLTALHKKFGKWYLAAIAYNCGDGKLTKAIKEAGTDDLSVLLDPKKKYLPRESRNYIRQILSVAIAFNSVDLLSNSNLGHFLNRGAGIPIATIKVKGGTHLEYVASSAGLSVSDIKMYNRHLKHEFTPPYKDEYDVYIPYENLSVFKESFDPNKKPKSYYVLHAVKKGDTLSSIAKKYKVDINTIKLVNALKTNRLTTRMELKIPTFNKQVSSVEIDTPNNYIVKNGDTLYSISKMFNVSGEEIAQINNIKNSNIKAGDKIVISN